MANQNPALNGLEMINANGGRANRGIISTQQIANLANGNGSAYNTSAITASGTLTAANISGGSAQTVLAFTGTFTAAGAITLPAASSLALALGGNVVAGQSYRLRIINTATSQTLTVTTATGWTLAGTMTIATATWRDFLVTFTTLPNTETGAVSACTLQNIGGGTIV